MGAATCRSHRCSGRTRRAGGEQGSAALELALVLPLVVLLLVVLLHAAVLGSDVVAAQGVAREAARVASVADDREVQQAVRRAAGRRDLRVEVHPPASARSAGDTVTASISLRSAAFSPFGADVWVPARAVMRVE